jgi:hypothetical protein
MHHALTIVRCHQPPGLVHSCAVFRGGAGVLSELPVLSGSQSMAWLLGQLGLRHPVVGCVLLVVC